MNKFRINDILGLCTEKTGRRVNVNLDLAERRFISAIALKSCYAAEIALR